MSDSTILKCGETPGKGLFPPNSKPVAVQGKWWLGPGKGSFPPGFEERSPKQQPPRLLGNTPDYPRGVEVRGTSTC